MAWYPTLAQTHKNRVPNPLPPELQRRWRRVRARGHARVRHQLHSQVRCGFGGERRVKYVCLRPWGQLFCYTNPRLHKKYARFPFLSLALRSRQMCLLQAPFGVSSHAQRSPLMLARKRVHGCTCIYSGKKPVACAHMRISPDSLHEVHTRINPLPLFLSQCAQYPRNCRRASLPETVSSVARWCRAASATLHAKTVRAN